MQRTAIITGGTLGFGRALAADLVRAGWYVVVDGRDPATAQDAAAHIGAHAVPGDVTDPEHRRVLIDAVRAATGRLDLLVNNASTLGASPLPRLERLSLEAFERTLRVNVVAPLGLIQEALPLLRASSGAVVNLTSDAAVEAYDGWGGYGSSKAALEQLSAVLAVEEPTVRVWWLDPGDLRTRMHAEAFPGEDISDRPEPEVVAPAVRALVTARPASGRFRAADLLASEVPA